MKMTPKEQLVLFLKGGERTRFKRIPRSFPLSPEDEDLLECSWCPMPGGYLRATSKKNPSGKVHTMVHHIVMERILGRKIVWPEVVDHINRDPADNRRENLRLVSVSLNCHNRHYSRNVGARYRNGNWYAGLTHNGVQISLGRCNSRQEAVDTVNRYKDTHGISAPQFHVKH